VHAEDSGRFTGLWEKSEGHNATAQHWRGALSKKRFLPPPRPATRQTHLPPTYLPTPIPRRRRLKVLSRGSNFVCGGPRRERIRFGGRTGTEGEDELKRRRIRFSAVIGKPTINA